MQDKIPKRTNPCIVYSQLPFLFQATTTFAIILLLPLLSFFAFPAVSLLSLSLSLSRFLSLPRPFFSSLLKTGAPDLPRGATWDAQRLASDRCPHAVQSSQHLRAFVS